MSNIMESIRYWDYGEQGVGQHCIRECEEIIKFFREKNQEKINVLDIGANVGKIYDFLSEKLNVETYIMYEASPILSKYLQEKYSENDAVKINNYAVSNCDGDVFIPENNIKTILDENKYEYFGNLGIQSVNNIQGTPIKQLSILDILENNKDFYEKIDLIKIDTESFDYIILEKMFSFIKKMDKKPLICFEHNYMFCNPAVSKEESEKIYNSYIKDCGYIGINFNELSGDGFLYPPKSNENKSNITSETTVKEVTVKENTKTKIRVHNPCNEFTRYYRNYNYFWDKFTEHLKKFFDVYENRYFENAHKERFPVKLSKGGDSNFLMLECEYVIENLENGEFVILSIADELSHAVINEQSNHFLKKVLISQFNTKKLYLHIDNKNYHKYSPWTYFQSQIFDLESFYRKRLSIVPSKEKLFFRGTSLEDRRFLYELSDDVLEKNFSSVPPDSYFNEIINHKIALSIDGRGEFCYRDIECFAIGVPIIRFEFESVFYDKLIPNYHYISIPRPQDMDLYRMGNSSDAKLMEDRYREVINDEEFLNFISKNAREYYLKNCEIENNVKRTFNLLNLNDWI